MTPEQSKILSEVTAQLRAALPDGEAALWKAFVKSMALALRCEAASFFTADDEHQLLTLASATGPTAEEVLHLTFGYRGIAGAAARERKTLISNNVASDPAFYDKVDRASGFVTRTLMAAPVIFAGRLYGVLELINPASGSFSEQNRELADFLCVSVARAASDLRKAAGLE